MATRVWQSVSTPPTPRLTSFGANDLPYATGSIGGGVAVSGLWGTVPYVPVVGGTIPAGGGLVTPASLPAWVSPPDSTWSALPDQPAVKFKDYFQTGDTLRDTLTRIQSALISTNSYKQVDLPDGFDMEFADFAMAGVNKYGLFFDRNLGFRGSHVDQARIRITAMSSTVGSGGTMMRLGDGRTLQPLGLRPLNYGWTLEGTDQPNMTYSQGGQTGPQLYSGFMQYYGRNAINQKVRLRGPSRGNWNSPPGETFSWNSYHTIDCIWRGCEVSGFNAQNVRSGGSPFGGNNSLRDVLEDCYFHDSQVSSTTWSFAGSHTDPNAVSSAPTTRRIRNQWNANHSGGGGQGFGTLNHENVTGPIRHYQSINILSPDNDGTSSPEWNAGFMSFASALGDNTDIQIINPVWNAMHPRMNGMFVVAMGGTYAGAPNKQVTPPIVKLNADPVTGAGGISLIPVIVRGPPSSTLPYSWTDHYVVII